MAERKQAVEILQEWLSSPVFDQDTKKELLQIRNDQGEVEDRFYRDLTFGTGGLRGVIGAGTNRMNIYTVRKATQGLAAYIQKNGDPKKGVAISYDCRKLSPEFARETALCLNANGIPTYLFDALRPTPELSFALRQLHCQAGVMITASHNPPEYNGYKVYWEDGAQITPPHDHGIISEVKAVEDFGACRTMEEKEAGEKGLFHVIGKEMDDAYLEALKTLTIHPEAVQAAAGKLKIVYTPLHGAGLVPVTRLLKELGYANVFVVPEQEDPDPYFTTLKVPNPEDPDAFRLALSYAKEQDADLVLATDPDSDRLGVYAKDSKDGSYKAFNGNMSGSLIAEYILRERTKTGTMPDHPALVTTIVTSNLAGALARDYGLHLVETLTGFKYIGEQIHLFEQNHSYHYVFGLEESYGCLPGTHARDKDAVAAVMMLCELAAFYRLQGKTLWDAMLDIYEKYGYYKEGQFSITMKGEQGAQAIRAMMDRLRENPPRRFGDFEVLRFRDYEKNIVRDYESGEEKETGLPGSNVLYFDLAGDAWCCVRPSGTEPKIKFYMGVKGKSLADAKRMEEKLEAAVRDAVR